MKCGTRIRRQTGTRALRTPASFHAGPWGGGGSSSISGGGGGGSSSGSGSSSSSSYFSGGLELMPLLFSLVSVCRTSNLFPTCGVTCDV